MKLYVNARKTLNVENRSEVKEKIPALIPYYDEIAKLDRTYEALTEELEEAEFNALDEWMEMNPDADMDEVYPTSYIAEHKPAKIDYPKYVNAFNEYRKAMDEWSQKYDEIAIKCKDVITFYLKDNGYDSMYFKVDGGSRGRETDSLILLDSNQVKSADLVTYDDNGNIIPLSERFNTENNDIRFSKPETTSEDISAEVAKASVTVLPSLKISKETQAKLDELVKKYGELEKGTMPAILII